MKKIIVFSLVLAMAAGAAFAVDLGGTVFGAVKLISADGVKSVDPAKPDDPTNKAGPLTGSGEVTRVRIEGAGESDDGTFGGWLRFDPTDGGSHIAEFVSGLAWWKPIEQLKVTIGGNQDGFYGKEGTAGWMFYQMPSDIGIVSPGNVWGGAYFPGSWGANGWTGPKYRNAFYGGFDGQGLMFDIKPADVFGVNIVVPYFNGGRLIDIWKLTTVQLDVNLDGIGNIALTYTGEDSYAFNTTDQYTGDQGSGIGANFYLYFNLTAVENLSLDFGVGLRLPENNGLDGDNKITNNYPLGIGLAAKMDVSDTFGFKARLLARLAGSTKTGGADAEPDGPFALGLDLLPYIGLADNVKLYIGLGLVLLDYPEVETPDPNDMTKTVKTKPDGDFGWHFNPYIQLGAEWGPTFYAGIRVYSLGHDKQVDPVDAAKKIKAGDTSAPNTYSPIQFEFPIGIQVSF
jgi:hypothetical protein